MPARGRHRARRRRCATRLDEALPLALDVARPSSDDARRRTRKWLWSCGADGAEIETVLMRYPTRATVCVSSQAGCAMGCTFCATGQAGFERHLDAGEIVEQVLRRAARRTQRVSNVVYMGMGEPLANYDAVWESVERLHADFGLSARHITVVDGRRRARDPAARDRGAAGHARRVAARARRRAARHAGPPEPPVPDRRGARRGARSSAQPGAGGSPSSTPASPGSTTTPRAAAALARLLAALPGRAAPT